MGREGGEGPLDWEFRHSLSEELTLEQGLKVLEGISSAE